jgi:hypothetical protein
MIEEKEILEGFLVFVKGALSIMFIKLAVEIFRFIRKHRDLLDSVFTFLCIALLCWYIIFSYIDAHYEQPPYGPVYFYIDVLTICCLTRLLIKSIKDYSVKWKKGELK